MSYEPPDVTLVDASSIGLNLSEEGSRMLYYSGKAEVPLSHWILVLPVWISL